LPLDNRPLELPHLLHGFAKQDVLFSPLSEALFVIPGEGLVANLRLIKAVIDTRQSAYNYY